MTVNVGDIFIWGELIRIKLIIIRIEKRRRNKVKIAWYAPDKTSVNKSDPGYIERAKRWTGKPHPYENSPWVPDHDWRKIKELDLRPVPIELLLEF